MTTKSARNSAMCVEIEVQSCSGWKLDEIVCRPASVSVTSAFDGQTDVLLTLGR